MFGPYLVRILRFLVHLICFTVFALFSPVSLTPLPQGKWCLERVPRLAATCLRHEAAKCSLDLLKLVVSMETRLEDPAWAALKRAAVEAIVAARPLVCLQHLVPVTFDHDTAIQTKFLVLDCLVGAGAVLAGRSDSDLGQFLTLAVGGLCAGGGSASSQEGLSRPLLAQLVTSAGALVQLGVACPGWQAWACDYMELLMNVVWDGPVAAAALGGLKGVAAAMPGQALRDGGRIGDLAAEAAAWAVGLDGELREAAREVVLLLARKREGVLRLGVEESLQPQQTGSVEDWNQQADISFGFDVNEELLSAEVAAEVLPPPEVSAEHNHDEIVNFVSTSWNTVSRDTSLKVCASHMASVPDAEGAGSAGLQGEQDEVQDCEQEPVPA